MANYLTLKDSFLWEDCSIDRSEFIDELNDAVDQARRFGDKTFGVPDLYDIKLSWGDFYDFLCSTQFEEEARKEKFPWLEEPQHRTLIHLFNIFQNTTENSARDLPSLNDEFRGANNSMIGIFSDEINQTYVFNEKTWIESHRIFVSNFKRQDIIQHKDYYDKYYIPRLSVDSNYINTLIVREQTFDIFDRLDTPTYIDTDNPLHGEQIQMHFKDKNKSALNLNGEWKHGGFPIPKDEGDQLIEWGFKLPQY